VFAASPEAIDASTTTGLDPDPGSAAHEALDPYPVVVPYSNLHAVTFCPSGLTLAFSVAEVCVRTVIASLLNPYSPFGVPTPSKDL